jgi:dCTP deaminase
MVKDGVLTDKDIKELISSGTKIVDPLEEDFIQSASIDLRLGDALYKYDMQDYPLGEEIVDDKIKKESFKEYSLKNGNTTYIGLYERVDIPENMIGLIMPRSSITRLGISIAPIYINPGYGGQMPLTISNLSGRDIILRPMTRVVQLILFYLSGTPEKTYGDVTGSKYLNEKISPSKLYMDKEIEKIIDTVMERETPDLFNLVKEKIKNG